MSLSYDLAKFLRYRAIELRMADRDGWVSVQDVLSRLGGAWSPEDIEVVVQESFTKDVPRFELNQEFDSTCVRAFNAQDYRSRRRDRREPQRALRDEEFRGGKGGGGGRDRDWDRDSNSSFRGAGGNARGGGYGFEPPAGGPWAGYRSNGRPAPQDARPLPRSVPSTSSSTRDPSSSTTASPDGSTLPGGLRAALGGPGQGGSTLFDGEWCGGDDGGLICRIEGTHLTWLTDDPVTQDLQIIGSMARMMPYQGRGEVGVGQLNAHGDLVWDDGDIFTRPASMARAAVPAEHDEASDDTAQPEAAGPAPQPPPPAGPPPQELQQQATAGLAPAAVSAAAAAPAATSAAAAAAAAVPDEEQDKWQAGMGPVLEERVLEQWDAAAFGPDYLTLKKGELIQVQRENTDANGGWAYGYSLQRETWGWFPPSYAKGLAA